MPAHTVTTTLRDFAERALAVRAEDCFTAEFDPQWRSPCELGQDQVSNVTRWRPVPQQPAVDFGGLENALECTIHPDIKAYYCSFWSGSFEARSTEGHVSLIQLWNSDDFDRLIANLIGHAIAKQKARQPFTVFFATTAPDSELFLSIDNESGSVVLEEPGRPPVKTVETDVASFLQRLEPVNSPAMIY